MDNEEGHKNETNGIKETSTVVREVSDDAPLKTAERRQDSQAGNGDHSSNNSHSSHHTETAVRDADSSSHGNSTASDHQSNNTGPKKYSFSVDAPAFVPANARKASTSSSTSTTRVDATIGDSASSSGNGALDSDDINALATPTYSQAVSGHLSNIAGAKEKVRATLAEHLKAIPSPVTGGDGAEAHSALSDGSSEGMNHLSSKLPLPC